MQITDAGAEVLHLVEKITKLTNRIEDLEGEILYLKGSFGRWAKESPTKPGWYWAVKDAEVKAVHVFACWQGTILNVAIPGSGATFGLQDISLWWSIPILEPPKPEDKCQNTKV